MRLLFPTIAAIAALASASTALAGPGCGGRSHDVTASTGMSPVPDAGKAMSEMAQAPEHATGDETRWADVLAFLDATAPEDAPPGTTLR
ncbi:hypothetical protein [Limimaricola litoreus]|uniref:Uncharacterized protein n=1 Tax=Limimaricola litoreus TaxID=2955316 RepID=A0A9X2JRH9_9RHOB|nr:hypothetical protein [Limimaricola litoreus]MCP1168736.1 hypothetical protein [Limimaricola litoreus]